MKNFITRQPILFAIGLTVVTILLEILVVVFADKLVGLPEPAVILIVLSVSVAIPLGFIWWLGWWQDAGFVVTVQNVPALIVPFLLIFISLPFFGIVAIEPKISVFILAIYFLTALGEESLSRGLLLRVLLPKGKWMAALVPSVLFGISHLTQLLDGLELTTNLLQISQAIIFGMLYAAVRMRINSIWPLVALHMLFDSFVAFSGMFGPAAIHDLTDVPILLWVVYLGLSLATAIYLLARRPITATINGQVPNKPQDKDCHALR